jgi:hypothetical protein
MKTKKENLSGALPANTIDVVVDLLYLIAFW